jgi:hypothetical protein
MGMTNGNRNTKDKERARRLKAAEKRERKMQRRLEKRANATTAR